MSRAPQQSKFRGSIRHLKAEEGVLSDRLERDPQRLGVRKTHKSTSGRKVLASWRELMPEHHGIPSCTRTPCPTFTSILGGVRNHSKGGAKVIKEVDKKREKYQDLFPCRCDGKPSPNMKFSFIIIITDTIL